MKHSANMPICQTLFDGRYMPCKLTAGTSLLSCVSFTPIRWRHCVQCWYIYGPDVSVVRDLYVLLKEIFRNKWIESRSARTRRCLCTRVGVWFCNCFSWIENDEVWLWLSSTQCMLIKDEEHEIDGQIRKWIGSLGDWIYRAYISAGGLPNFLSL